MEHSLKAVFVLCLSLSLCSVESQERPPSLPSSGARLYLPTEHVSLANFTMLDASEFNYQDLDKARDNITDALWCQSDAVTTIGTWYYPTGVNNLVPTNVSARPLWIMHYNGQVGLYRDGGIPGREGLFRCVIIDSVMTEHTFYVGIYRTPTYINYTGPVVDNNMQFKLTSPRDADPPQFNLVFNTSSGPPTHVNCSLGDTDLDITEYSVTKKVLKTQFNDTSNPDLTEVTVTVRKWLGGMYRCTVFVANSTGGIRGQNSTSIQVTATGAPLDVNARRIGTNSIVVYWTAPQPAPVDYEVFYWSIAGGNRHGTVTSSTSVTITVQDYSPLMVMVVAFGGMLPSRSKTESVAAATTSTFQLRAGLFHYCTNENSQAVKPEIMELFRSTVVQVIKDRCHCNISASFIYAGDLLCDSQYAPSHVIYRASIDSIGVYSAGELVSFIDEWIRGGANLTNGFNFITFDPNCEVQINSSDPPCNGSTPEQPTTLVSPTLSGQVFLTPTNIALCAVVVLLAIALAASVIGCSVIWYYCRRRQTLLAKLAGDPPLRQSFAGNLIYVRYGEAPSTKENKYKSLKSAQSSSTLLQRPLPEEPTNTVNPAAVFYDQEELESSTYINVEGKDRNMYERVSFSRKGRRASLSKHAVIAQPEPLKAEATYVPMHASNPLRDRSATSLGEVNDTYATVGDRNKSAGQDDAANPKPDADKPQLPPPYASGDDTYATVDKPKKTESDSVKPSAPPPPSDTYTVVNKPKRIAEKPGTTDDKTPPPVPPFAAESDTYTIVNKPKISTAQDESNKDEELNESGLGKFTSTSALLPK